MSVDVYKIMLKRLEETEKSAEGGFLFLLRKDGYTYRYFKREGNFLIGKHFYDVSLCSKEWFEKNLADTTELDKELAMLADMEDLDPIDMPPSKEECPFYRCLPDGDTSFYEIIDITEEEYLEAKKEFLATIETAKRKEFHNKATDGKSEYEFFFNFNDYVFETVYVRAHNFDEAKVLAREEHSKFTKDWVFPDAYLLSSCKLENIVLPIDEI